MQRSRPCWARRQRYFRSVRVVGSVCCQQSALATEACHRKVSGGGIPPSLFNPLRQGCTCSPETMHRVVHFTLRVRCRCKSDKWREGQVDCRAKERHASSLAYASAMIPQNDSPPGGAKHWPLITVVPYPHAPQRSRGRHLEHCNHTGLAMLIVAGRESFPRTPSVHTRA